MRQSCDVLRPAILIVVLTQCSVSTTVTYIIFAAIVYSLMVRDADVQRIPTMVAVRTTLFGCTTIQSSLRCFGDDFFVQKVLKVACKNLVWCLLVAYIPAPSFHRAAYNGLLHCKKHCGLAKASIDTIGVPICSVCNSWRDKYTKATSLCNNVCSSLGAHYCPA